MSVRQKLFGVFLVSSVSVSVALAGGYGGGYRYGGNNHLRGVIRKVLDHHPAVNIVLKQSQQAQKEIAEAKAAYYPTVDVTAEMGRERSKNSNTRNVAESRDEWLTLTRRSARADMVQNVFKGGDSYHRVRANIARFYSANQRLHNAVENIALGVVEAYLNVLREQKLVAISRKNVQDHLRSFRTIKDRAETGLSRKTEEQQASARLALARSNLHAELNQLKDANARYIRFVGRKPGRLRTPSMPNSRLPRTLGQAIQQAIKYHPAIESARDNFIARRHLHKASAAPFYPQLDVVLSSDWGENLGGQPGLDFSNSAVLRLSYNLFRGGADKARRARSAYAKQEALSQIHDRAREAVEAVRFAWHALKADQAQLKPQRQHMDMSRRTITSYREQFQLGKRTLIDLLNAKNEYFGARREYTNGQFAVLVDKFRLLNSMGLLLKTLDIHPDYLKHEHMAAK